MSKAQRLKEKIADLQRDWNLLKEKLSKLNKNYILENRPDDRLSLKNSIDNTTTQLTEVERQLDDMESQLAEVNSNPEEAVGRKGGQDPEPLISTEERQVYYYPNNPPIIGQCFIGRNKYLNILNQVWIEGKINILVIRAGFGGEGKSALVYEWLQKFDPVKKEGAERIYWWTFYSQEVQDKGKLASSDPFIEHALSWFGDSIPSNLKPKQKANRLVELMRKNRTLLILDSLEPFQFPYGPGSERRLKDPAMLELLNELAKENKGLCIITTRAEVIELKSSLKRTVKELKLPNLSVKSGVNLLKNLGVKIGSDDDFKKVVENVKGHALTLTLLGNYLCNARSGDIRYCSEIGLYEVDEKDEKGNFKFRRIMKAYERWLENKPLALAIMRLLGFLVHQVDMQALEELKKIPIQGLTDTISNKISDWNDAISNLRNMGLISKEDDNAQDMLDNHPFIREYFAERVREQVPGAWQEGHGRLYRYYAGCAKENPNTIDEMLPLFTAVSHGCKAGLHEEVLEQVYRLRIMKGDEYFSTNKLGAISSELVALTGFFDELWTRPVSNLTEVSRGYLLKEAGFHLLALGRPKEAVGPTEQALEIWENRGDQQNAVEAASKLGELYLTLGCLNKARNYAEQSEKLAGQIDRDKAIFHQQIAKANLAAILHQLGEFDEANNAFEEAAKMQKEREPERPLLHSWQGFRYCDLLLDRGEKGSRSHPSHR